MNASSPHTELTSFLLLAKQHVIGLFKRHWQPYLHYHNLQHTQQVVENVIMLATHYELNPVDCAILETAAWFHDTGHLFGPTLGHEEAGVARFYEFLNDHPCDAIPAERIALCILSTKMPQQPSTFLGAIICDADTYHLGTAQFSVTDALLKREITERTGAVPAHWEVNTLDLLRTHRYHTSYCYVKQEAGKQRNYEQYLEKAQSMMLL